MIICTYTYITFIVFMSENSLLANVYFTLYPTLNKILLTYLLRLVLHINILAYDWQIQTRLHQINLPVTIQDTAAD